VNITYNNATAKGIQYFNEKVLPRNEVDSRVYAYCVDVPKLPRGMAYFVGILNVILPGVGTMISSASAFSADQKMNKT